MEDLNDILWETAAAAAKISVGLEAVLSRKAPPEGLPEAPEVG